MSRVEYIYFLCIYLQLHPYGSKQNTYILNTDQVKYEIYIDVISVRLYYTYLRERNT